MEWNPNPATLETYADEVSDLLKKVRAGTDEEFNARQQREPELDHFRYATRRIASRHEINDDHRVGRFRYLISKIFASRRKKTKQGTAA